MKPAEMVRIVLLFMISPFRIFAGILIGMWRRKGSLQRVERESAALGFGYQWFDIDEARGRLLGRFGDVVVDAQLLDGRHAGLHLYAPLNVAEDRLAESESMVREALEDFRRETVGWFGSVELQLDMVKVRYEGFFELYPCVEPATIRRLVHGLVGVVDRITLQLGAAQTLPAWRRRLLFDDVESCDLDAVKFAIQQGVDPAEADEDGHAALHFLDYDEGYDPEVLELAGLLLDAGANPDAADDDGVTPLMKAARAGSGALVALLLSRGADATLKDTWGDTALTYADGEEEIEDLLRAAAAT